MSYVLRQITGARWLGLGTPKSDGDFPADPITDLKTDSNNLSVFFIEDAKRDIDTALIGLASNKNEVQKLTYALIKLKDLEKEGFKITANTGKTPSGKANHLHGEIEGLTVDGLAKLARLISDKSQQETKPKPFIKILVQGACASNDLNIKKMRHDLHKELKIICECK